MTFLAALIIFCSGLACAGLSEKIEAIINSPSQKGTVYSVNIIEPKTGRVIYAHNANAAMIPASNMKIVTTAAALKFLGPDFVYKTQVYLCDGNLIVKASGDPLLGDEATDKQYGRSEGWVFEKIIDSLKAAGVTKIENIVIDTTIFSGNPVHPNWPKDQLNRWYACEVTGLNYNDNCIDITVTNKNGKIEIDCQPLTGFIKIQNDVTPIRNGSGAAGAYRTPGKPNYIKIFGKCRKQQGPFDVAIENPPGFFGFMLYEKLNTASINCSGKLLEMGSDNCGTEKLVTEFSTPLSDCLKRCNKNSLGLAAESLLKTIAANTSATGKNGSWERGSKVISGYLESLRIDKGEFIIDDGSGLSRQNRLSTNALSRVICDMYNQAYWNIYKDSLAVGGQDGTIEKYFGEQKYRGKILGKTGYIDLVKSFSGVCLTDNGDYVFSIIVNKANGKSRLAINNIAEAIIDCYE